MVRITIPGGAERFPASHERHRQVQDDNVGPLLFGDLDCLGAVFGLPDDLHAAVGQEHLRDPAPKLGVVVREHHPDGVVAFRFFRVAGLLHPLFIPHRGEPVMAPKVQMRPEEALRASEEKYRTLFDLIDEGFCTIEVLFDEHGEAVDYRFLESNPAFERQTGLENAVGKTVRELAPEHEDFWFDVYGRLARTGEAIRFEHEAAALGRFYDVYAFRIGEPGEDRVPDGVETNLSATGDETAVPRPSESRRTW